MLLRYADDSRFYVPLERMDLVQSYRVVEGAIPRSINSAAPAGTRAKPASANRSKTWRSSFSSLRRRKTAPGLAFSLDGNFQREFEDAFEFEETPDQNSAIADIKRDMESATAHGPARLRRRRLRQNRSRHARRLQSDRRPKQVAVLVPTTVLAVQHFETFSGASPRFQ